MIKRIAIAVGAVLATAATSASAQVYYDRPHYREYYVDRAPAVRECWNQRAGRYEVDRPGEFQDDLDPFNCRIIGDPYYVRRDRRVDYDEQCWNWRARRYEDVRPGEYQDDLDYNRCRLVREGPYAWRYR